MRHSHILLRVVLLLLGIVLLSTAASHAASVTVRVGSVQAAPGKQAQIPITVEGSPGMVAMHLELTYNPAILEVETVDPGPLLEGKALMEFNTEEVGRLVIGFASAEEIAGDGTLAVARFQVNGEVGQTSPLGLENGRAWDEIGVDIIVNTEAGEFTVSSAGLPLLLLLAAALAVVLFFLLLLIVMRRRRRQPAVVPPPRPAQVTGVGPKFCSQCGHRLEPGKRFCTNCGQPVAG
jgi:hypothetical protein